MAMIDDRISDRLYLSKGDQEIYIDLQNESQYQVDGIRYLYRLYKKQKPGVIVNYPPGSGERLQILLFLNAIQRLLEKPVLVLCREDYCAKWQKGFSKWINTSQILTQASEGIASFAKWRVVITTAVNAAQCSHRVWSVVVNDDEDSKKLLKTKLHGFKICVTSVDMREHLQLFSQIYHWLYPKEEFNITEYTANKERVTDVVTKTILLDAFMEGIVLRRTGDTVPFSRDENINNNVGSKRVSRKNKDSTGTKVKRSKNHLGNHTQLSNFTHIIENSSPKDIDKEPKIENSNSMDEIVEISEDETMDVESFIRNHKPITEDNFKEFLFDDVIKTGKNVKADVINDFQETSLKVKGDLEHTEIKLFEDIVEDSCKVGHEDLANDLKITSDFEINASDYNGIDLKEDTVKASITKTVSASEVNYKYNKSFDSTVEVMPSDMELDCDENKVEIQLKSEVKANIKTNGDLNNSTDTSNSRKTDLEQQISEIEQNAIKKFKGSLLDSIF